MFKLCLFIGIFINIQFNVIALDTNQCTTYNIPDSSTVYNWSPNLFSCEISLQSNNANARSVTIRIPAYLSVLYSTNKCSQTPSRSCSFSTSSGTCFDLSYRTPVNSASWNSFRSLLSLNSDQIIFQMTDSIALFYCGNVSLTVIITIGQSIVAPTAASVGDDSSDNLMTHVVIPTLGACVVVVLLAFIFLYFVRRSALQQAVSSASTDTQLNANLGVANAAFTEEPPSYKDIHNYPLSENYKKQLEEMENKIENPSTTGMLTIPMTITNNVDLATPSHIYLPTSTAFTNLHSVLSSNEKSTTSTLTTTTTTATTATAAATTTVAAGGMEDFSQSGRITPPPLYDHTRRIILATEADVVSIYEAVDNNSLDTVDNNEAQQQT